MVQTLDPELVESLLAAVREVLETMAAMTPHDVAAVPTPPPVLRDQVVGLLGFTGSHCGTFVVRTSERLARTIAARMLQQEPDELDGFDATADGFGELINMIGGHFKNGWVARGHRMFLSFPNVVHNGAVRVEAGHARTRHSCVRLRLPAGELFAGLMLEPAK